MSNYDYRARTDLKHKEAEFVALKHIIITYY